MSQMSPKCPCPTPTGPRAFPVVNQRERMLPALGQWQQPSPSSRGSEAAVGGGVRYPLAPSPCLATSHAEPGTTRRAWKMWTLPAANHPSWPGCPELKIPWRLPQAQARAQGMNGGCPEALQPAGLCAEAEAGSHGRRALPGVTVGPPP